MGPSLPCAALLLALAACHGDPGADPVEVAPADGALEVATLDGGAGPSPAGGALWVEDADGVTAGVLVRRGGDDAAAGRVIYDLVTVFHPDSGLFFDLTMADGVVRYPATTFFNGSGCGQPVGVTAGGCSECRSAFGLAFLHDGAWWRVEGGATSQQRANGSSRGPGVASPCVAHGSANTKVFPVEAVTGPAPPTTFAAPLRFSWR